MEEIYIPREDSIMLKNYIKQYAKGSVLDISIGSAIQAIATAQNKKVNCVLAIEFRVQTPLSCKVWLESLDRSN